MENGEPSVKRIKTEPVEENSATQPGATASQGRLVIDPQRVQHLKEITKQFDSKHTRRTVTNIDSKSVANSTSNSVVNTTGKTITSIASKSVTNTAQNTGLNNIPKTVANNIQRTVTNNTLQVTRVTESVTVPRPGRPGRPSNLDRLLYRLNSETCTTTTTTTKTVTVGSSGTPSTNSSDSNMATKEAGTQTAVSMVQLIKSIIRDRMKALQDSVFKDAAVDSLMNGKLLELRKENKELKECLDKLQAKYDDLLAQCKLVRKQDSAKKKQPLGSTVTTLTDKQTPADSSRVNEQATAIPVTTNLQGHVANSQPGSFIALQNSARAPMARAKVGATLAPSSGIRPASVSYTPANRVNIHARGQSQQIQQVQGQPPVVQTVHPPGQHQLQGYVNNQVNKVGPPGQMMNAHGHQVSPSVLPVQQQVMPGQGSMMNAAGQLVNAKGQPIAAMPGQIRASQPVRYEYMNQAPLGNIRPAATTQVVFASQGSRVTADLRVPALPPNYEQATSGQTVHYTPSTAGPRPRMAQPLPNYVQNLPVQRQVVPSQQQARKHDAVPAVSSSVNRANMDSLPLPPRLTVTISASGTGIVLSWDVEAPIPANAPSIECYHLFAYQDGDYPPHMPQSWKRIGVVKALPLPMACTLTQFVSGSAYHFAIMAVDMFGREGPMSNPCTIRLSK